MRSAFDAHEVCSGSWWLLTSERESTAEIATGEAIFGFFDFGEAALGDDVTAANAGSGSKIDEEVGGAHGIFVVFDDDERIAEIAKALE